MTYYPLKNSKINIIELSMSANQSVSTGSTIIFDTFRTTNSLTNVTFNQTTGLISLNPQNNYMLEASTHFYRGNQNTDAIIGWKDENNNVLSYDKHAYPGGHLNSSRSARASGAVSTYIATYQPSFFLNHPYNIKLYVESIYTGSEIRKETKVIIFEEEIT